MRYELQMFEDFVLNKLLDTNISTYTDFELEKWIDIIPKETSTIKNALMVIAFSNLSEKIVERKIQTYQSQLILLSNGLAKLIKTKAISDLDTIDQTNLPLKVKISLMNNTMSLLSYIEEHFSKYFSESAPIPSTYFYNSKAYLSQHFKQFHQVLQSRNVNPTFVRVIMDPLESFMKAASGTTFKELMYCKTYLKEIEAVLQSDACGFKLERKLIISLFYLNYNTYHFYNYVAKKITIHYQSKSNFQRQLESLQLFKKLINQSPIKPDHDYIIGAESIKEQLRKWVEEELEYFTSKKQIEIKFSEYPFTNNLNVKETDKIECNLSVAQIAYSMKLLVKSNIIAAPSMEDLLELISKNFSTKNQKEISKSSLRNKFYTAESSTIQHIQKVMNELINNAEEDKTKI